MSYEDIEEARAKRAAKEQAAAGKGKRGRKRKSPAEEAGAPESAKAKVARMGAKHQSQRRPQWRE